MIIKEFLEKIKNGTDLKEILEIRTYIPIAEKRVIFATVLSQCFDIEDGVLICDYLSKKTAFELAMIKYHTDLEVDITSEDDYDTIQNLLSTLHSLYLTDYQECCSLFEGVEREFCAQYSVEASIASLCNNISNEIGYFVNRITAKVDSFDMGSFGFEGEELDQLKNFLNKYGSKV